MTNDLAGAYASMVNAWGKDAVTDRTYEEVDPRPFRALPNDADIGMGIIVYEVDATKIDGTTGDGVSAALTAAGFRTERKPDDRCPGGVNREKVVAFPPEDGAVGPIGGLR